MERLHLKEVDAFELFVPTDEVGNVGPRTYYKDKNIAAIDGNGAGFYGADGIVSPVKLWQDTKGNLYRLEAGGALVDADKNYKETVRQRIAERLGPVEAEFMGLIKKEPQVAETPAPDKPKRTPKPKEVPNPNTGASAGE